MIVCIFIIIVTFFTIPKDSFLCLGVILAGIPVYIVGVKWKKPKSVQSKIDAVTVFIQKVTYSICDESKLE